eukprot:scaffold1110_cov399-Pavlova_lutheri.AAC.9
MMGDRPEGTRPPPLGYFSFPSVPKGPLNPPGAGLCRVGIPVDSEAIPPWRGWRVGFVDRISVPICTTPTSTLPLSKPPPTPYPAWTLRGVRGMGRGGGSGRVGGGGAVPRGETCPAAIDFEEIPSIDRTYEHDAAEEGFSYPGPSVHCCGVPDHGSIALPIGCQSHPPCLIWISRGGLIERKEAVRNSPSYPGLSMSLRDQDRGLPYTTLPFDLQDCFPVPPPRMNRRPVRLRQTYLHFTPRTDRTISIVDGMSEGHCEYHNQLADVWATDTRCFGSHSNARSRGSPS